MLVFNVRPQLAVSVGNVQDISLLLINVYLA